jgi:hypothetical protein
MLRAGKDSVKERYGPAEKPNAPVDLENTLFVLLSDHGKGRDPSDS